MAGMDVPALPMLPDSPANLYPWNKPDSRARVTITTFEFTYLGSLGGAACQTPLALTKTSEPHGG
jgi:hypothetical protein